MITLDYTGYNVLVTGGSSGIGNAIARAFADAGASVTVTGTRATAAEYEDDLSTFTYRQLDVADAAAIDAFVEATGDLDVLVNNAGTAIRMEEAQTPAGFERNIDINLNSIFRLSQGLRSRLAKRPGSIISIASMTSYVGSPRVPGYGASKAAVLQLTKTMGELYASDGIRANAIAPGWIATKMTVPVRTSETISAPILARTPMGRFGKPEEMAGTALYLASDKLAGFVTGVTIPVDGGYIAC